MEIRIKTADEFRSSHVTIEIVAADASGAADVALSLNGQGVHTDEELINAQYSEGELIRRALTADLEKLRAEQRDLNRRYLELDARFGEAQAVNARMARELRDAEQSAATFKAQAYEQNDRAAVLAQQLKHARAAHERTRQRVETVSGQYLKAESDLAKASDRIEQAMKALTDPKVEQARRMDVSLLGTTMGRAIAEAMEALTDTSQA